MLVRDRAGADDPSCRPGRGRGRPHLPVGWQARASAAGAAGTAVGRALGEAHERGAVMAGCSAGAMVLAGHAFDFRLRVMPLPLRWGAAWVSRRAISVVPHYDAWPEPLSALIALQAPRGSTVLGIDEGRPSSAATAAGRYTAPPGSRSGEGAAASDFAPARCSGCSGSSRAGRGAERREPRAGLCRGEPRAPPAPREPGGLEPHMFRPEAGAELSCGLERRVFRSAPEVVGRVGSAAVRNTSCSRRGRGWISPRRAAPAAARRPRRPPPAPPAASDPGSVGPDRPEAVGAVHRPVHPRSEGDLGLVPARRAHDGEVLAVGAVITTLVPARAADVTDVGPAVAGRPPTGPAARAALGLAGEALLDVVLLVRGGMDEFHTAVDAAEGPIDVGHVAPPGRVGSAWCAAEGGRIGGRESEVWRNEPGPRDPGAELESLSVGAHRSSCGAGYNGSRKRTCQRVACVTTYLSQWPARIRGGERGVMGAPRSRQHRDGDTRIVIDHPPN